MQNVPEKVNATSTSYKLCELLYAVLYGDLSQIYKFWHNSLDVNIAFQSLLSQLKFLSHWRQGWVDKLHPFKPFSLYQCPISPQWGNLFSPPSPRSAWVYSSPAYPSTYNPRVVLTTSSSPSYHLHPPTSHNFPSQQKTKLLETLSLITKCYY